MDLERFRLRRFLEALPPAELQRVEEPIALGDVAAVHDGNAKAVWFKQAGGAELAANVTAGATTVTAGFGSQSPTVKRLEIHEYAGMTASNPLDGTATNIGEGTTTPDTVTSGAAQTTVSAPVPDGSHTLTAVARDAAGNQATSAAVTVTVNNDATPPVISAVTVSSVTSSGATIGWTTNEVSDSEVEYGPTTAYGGFSALDGSLVTGHTMSLGGLSPNTQYHFRVRSRDAGGNLGLSGDFTFTTLDGTPPSVSITSPAANATVSGTISVTASASDNIGVAGVTFRVDGVPLGAEDTVAPYSVAWNTAAQSPGNHTLTAVARDTAGNQATSAGVTVTVANSNGQVTVAWDASPDPNVVGYKVYVGTTSGVYSVSVVDVGNVTTYTVTGLQPGTVYVATTAYDQSGLESGFSNEVSTTIP